MLDILLTAEQRALRDQARTFAREVPRQLLLDMDADKVRYPREYMQKLAARNLLGLRFPKEFGGRAELGVRSARARRDWRTRRVARVPVLAPVHRR